MNLAPVDWAIILVVMGVLVAGALISRIHMRSVADFLAAGRSAGRYLLAVSQGIAMLGAISIIAYLEQNYVAGFPLTWWGLTMALVVLTVTASGWIIYRFRQTRCLTLAEFFERRYSRRFRMFAGTVAFAAGIVNFGIFPAVGARFFINFIGLPASTSWLGLRVSTFPVVMLVLLSLALFFVFSGGQIAVLITDFIQGIFVNVVFIVIAVFLVVMVRFDRIGQALATAPANASLINPFQTGEVQHFNLWFFLIGVLIYVYGAMSWQGTQAYNTSATSAHEAKMGLVLSNWRIMPQAIFLLVVPVVAYTVLHHAAFADQALRVQGLLDQEPSAVIQNQLRVPAVLVAVLPTGLTGAFAAVMLAAFISTHDTYLHSWGSILVQDVIMPFRATPFSPAQHLRALRWAIVGVAAFIFVFSLLFQQSQYIFLFFAITGAVFFGGAGAVLIGGLYWRRGTTAAAWSAMVTGSGIALGGIIVHQLEPGFFIDGQMFSGIAIAGAVLVYVIVSLLGREPPFELDRLLHRGAFALPDETHVVDPAPPRFMQAVGMGREFTRGDRVIYVVSFAWIGAWVLVFLLGTIINLRGDVSDGAWMAFWRVYVYIQLAVSAGVVLWLAAGGIVDVRSMLRRLREGRRDHTDDGFVADRSGNVP
ncbi:MAG TPA: hypothetical protein VGA37_10250 [Gemmatimonadales bacterium]